MKTTTNSVTIPGYPDLLAIACRTLDVIKSEILSQNKSRHLADIRHLIAWVTVREMRMTNADAAQLLERDWRTIYYSLKHADDLICTDAAFVARVTLLTNQLKPLCSIN